MVTSLSIDVSTLYCNSEKDLRQQEKLLFTIFSFFISLRKAVTRKSRRNILDLQWQVKKIRQEKKQHFVVVNNWRYVHKKNIWLRPEPCGSPFHGWANILYICSTFADVSEFVYNTEREPYFPLPLQPLYLLNQSIRTDCILCNTVASQFSVSSLSFFCSGTRFSPVWTIIKNRNKFIIIFVK